MTQTVLIVDDHAGFRTWARAMLETEGFTVVGETADGASGEVAVRSLRPDVVLLDIVLPDQTGFQVARHLSTLQPMPAVILVSSREAADYGPRIALSPARGFLSKAELTGDRVRALLGEG